MGIEHYSKIASLFTFSRYYSSTCMQRIFWMGMRFDIWKWFLSPHITWSQYLLSTRIRNRWNSSTPNHEHWSTQQKRRVIKRINTFVWKLWKTAKITNTSGLYTVNTTKQSLFCSSSTLCCYCCWCWTSQQKHNKQNSLLRYVDVIWPIGLLMLHALFIRLSVCYSYSHVYRAIELSTGTDYGAWIDIFVSIEWWSGSTNSLM